MALSLSGNFNRVFALCFCDARSTGGELKLKRITSKGNIEGDLISRESASVLADIRAREDPRIETSRFHLTFEARPARNKAPSRQIQTNSIMNSRQTGRERSPCCGLFQAVLPKTVE